VRLRRNRVNNHRYGNAKFIDNVPTPAEADLIRDALKIKRKRHYTPDQLATITARLRKKTTRDPSRPAHIRQKRKKASG
jgi:hypothetical protein